MSNSSSVSVPAGILRKNYKFVRQLEEVDARAKEIAERMSRAKVQLDALKLRLELDKPSTRYKLTTPDNPTILRMTLLRR